ncbi:MAG TPA: thiamine pyrophosphate-binding protein [Polyangiaceae bacterium]
MNDPAFDLVPESSPRPRQAASAAVLLLRTLAHRGVRVAFGIPGGSASPIFDGLNEVPEIRFVATRHEAMAGFAATGYARATGRPALVLTTSGPGLTNAITGMAAATLEELPVIVLAGEIASAAVARGGLQDGSPAGLDTLGTVRSMTRWATTLTSADAASATAERAWQLATGERPGPVYVGVPLDVGSRVAAFRPPLATSDRPPAMPDLAACDRAVQALRGARRPLLLLGNGARSASVAARSLAERLSLPTAVTGHAKGVFPESHRLYLGLIGVGQHPSVSEYLREPPDVACIVGSRLGDIATNGWQTPIAGTVDTIQIDREALLLGRNVPVTLGIVGDARATLEAMLEHCPAGVPPARDTPRCRSVRAELAHSESMPLKPQRAIAALDRAFPGAIWCSDIGEHLTMALHYLRVDRPDRFHAMTGFGSMGSGIGAAIGMKLARPDATVIALCGDGGLAMHAGEILTCVEHGLGVLFAVFNNGSWGMIDQGFRAVYGRLPPGMPSRVADLAAVARGFGAEGFVVRSAAELEPSSLQSLARTGRPVVLDVRIDGTESLTCESRAATVRHFAQGA